MAPSSTKVPCLTSRGIMGAQGPASVSGTPWLLPGGPPAGSLPSPAHPFSLSFGTERYCRPRLASNPSVSAPDPGDPGQVSAPGCFPLKQGRQWGRGQEASGWRRPLPPPLPEQAGHLLQSTRWAGAPGPGYCLAGDILRGPAGLCPQPGWLICLVPALDTLRVRPWVPGAQAEPSPAQWRAGSDSPC